MYTERIEARPWFDAGQPVDGRYARQLLEQSRSQHAKRSRCVYVHVPFCESICEFCALYTKAVKRDKTDVFDRYLDYVGRAIETHPYAGLGQAPTTVHFGGGTPLHIGMERFARLTDHVRRAFGDSPRCEWAVETTTSSIDRDTMAVLQQLHFQRIHLGVQTLDDGIRQRIGRRESGRQCIDKIHQLHGSGFLTSVDLIIGFDGMTETVVDCDLSQLYEAGIRMFSICELRLRSRREWKNLHTPDRLAENRRLWQRIWRFMQDRDLMPIHLGQFGRSYEDNLYFTHPARGEDCIAIGPYAHGSSGPLYYGNKLLPDYYTALEDASSPIGHGVLYDHDIQVIRQLESELLAHRISNRTLDDVASVYGVAFTDIQQSWREHRFMVPGENGHWVLSCDGSWFVGNMIMHLRRLPEAAQLGGEAAWS